MQEVVSKANVISINNLILLPAIAIQLIFSISDLITPFPNVLTKIYHTYSTTEIKIS